MPKTKPYVTQQPRFFVAPREDIFADLEKVQSSASSEQTRLSAPPKREKKMKYAAYMRISSEEQVGNFSIDAQERAIQTWVVAQGGLLVKIYKDEAQSGRTIDRPAFLQMRKDARKGKFDALVVHKFDRFARNRTDALAIKSLLRYDYGVKVFSVTEPSEDSDGPMGALVEGVMESVADWYSKNLAAEVAKGKKERSLQGYHNNVAPFGYTKDKNKILIPHPTEADGLRMAFDLYSQNKHSDGDLARVLNREGHRTKKGRKFSKDTVRAMMRNRTYTGRVRYSKTNRNADGSRNRVDNSDWFDGQHEALVSDELFEKCMIIRNKRAKHRQATKKYIPYLLRDIAYCYRCCVNRPDEKVVPSYGKLRPRTKSENSQRYYRCRARDLGYNCEQPGIPVEIIEEQVLEIVKFLCPPQEWRTDIVNSIGELLGEKDLNERLAEIRERIQRMDLRWDHGFVTDEGRYMRERLKLQQELEALTPVDNDDLERAADLLKNFSKHWVKCGEDTEQQAELLKQIVERVYIEDDRVVAMTLQSNCHLVLGHNTKEPTEYTVDPFVSNITSTQDLNHSGTERFTCGSDGI